MMHDEFTKLSGMEISFEDYNNIVEPLYMSSGMNKNDFVAFIKPSIKPLAKKYATEKAKKPERPVFIWNGKKDCKGYLLGEWAILKGADVCIATGKTILKLRSMTDTEYTEINRKSGLQPFGEYDRYYDWLDDAVIDPDDYRYNLKWYRN